MLKNIEATYVGLRPEFTVQIYTQYANYVVH